MAVAGKGAKKGGVAVGKKAGPRVSTAQPGGGATKAPLSLATTDTTMVDLAIPSRPPTTHRPPATLPLSAQLARYVQCHLDRLSCDSKMLDKSS